MVRGELFRIPPPKNARGHEHRGARYAVVVQADEFLGLSTLLVCPTSTSARAASFRPTITLAGQETPRRRLAAQAPRAVLPIDRALPDRRRSSARRAHALMLVLGL
jgi:mRNA interferase MazF